MWRKDKWNFVEAVVAVAVAMAFILPGATAFANVGTIGITSDIENTSDMENLDAENTDVQPLPPKPKHHYFYGTLTLYGEPAPIGTEVRAEGINVNQGTIITTQVGYYGVPDPKLDVWGYYITDGTVLTFFVDGETTGQSYEFHQNEVTQFNLTTGVNNPPYVPKDPDPWDGETGVAVDVELSWTGGDPDGNPVTYDVYFGDTCPPPQIVWNQSDTTYDPPGDLDEKSLYYWQIVTWDNQSLSTSGPIWTFITLGPPGVIYVDDDAHPSWYDHWHVHTIQEGVNNASSGEGDTVYVFKGTYHEHVTVGKQLEMVGAYRETVIVDGDGSGNVFYVTVSGVNISGFTMMNGKKGIYLKSNLNNINIVDCNVFGNTECGIDISRASYSSVVNCSVHDNVGGDMYNRGNGIYALAAAHCDIIGNTAYNNVGFGQQYSGMGIGLSTSTYCKLRDNVLYDNQYNFGITGNNIPYYENHDIDTSNTVNGKPIHFVIGAEDEVIDGDVTDIGLVILVRCDNVTVKNVETSNNRAGIMLAGTMNSLITDCSFSNGYFGIWLYVRSAFNRIVNCNLFDNGEHGIRTQDDSSWNEIVNCNIYGNIKAGYWSQGTVNNSLIGCNIYNNGLSGTTDRYCGIRFDYHTDNNLVEDCHIYGNRYGITIDGTSIVQTIRNCELNNNILYGLIISSTSIDCIMENVSAHDNGYGIYISSAGTSMKNCTIDDNTYSFGLGTSSVDIDTSNTINGKPIGLFIGEIDLVFDETSDFGWLGLISCTNVTIKNIDIEGIYLKSTPTPVIDNVVSHNTIGSGIYLGSSPNGEITNCITYDNSGNGICLDSSSSGFNIIGCTSYSNSGDGGIYPYSSGNIADCDIYDNSGIGIYCRGFSDSTITNCDVYNNGGDGIYFLVSHHSSITDCDIYDNQKGVYIFRSSDNSIVNCDLYGNEYGIHLYYDSARNTITNCDSYNNEYGIYVSYRSSDNNVIHHNNFVGNGNNSYDARTNQWDDGTIGNHWSDYTGVDEDPEDGIGDTPYNITGGSNQDRYPLMEPLLEAPSLLLPADGSGTEDQTPTFDWTDIKPLYPVTYTLLVANDTGFTNIVIEETDLTESEYTPDLIEPTDELTTVEPMIFFDWTDAYDAYGIDYYILQVATDDTFTDIVAEETPADSECALPLATADDYYWRTQAVDNNGLLGDWSETWMFTRLVDTTPPTVELTYPVGGEDLRGTVEITWTATDDYTPSSVLLIDIDYRCGGDWQVMSSGEENDGTYTWDTTLYPDSEDYEIRITTEDDWGSIGSDRSYPAITVDNTAPVTTVDLYPADPDGENNWYVSSIHITLLATDEPGALFATGEPFGFGVDYTMYRINEGDWQEYGVPFTVTEDDEYTLEFYSVDYAGNEETVKSVNFKIDKTAPTIDLTVEKTGLMKWLLTATVSDETSGVAKVEFYLDGELLGTVTESPYEWECTERGTAHAIVYDNAGNEAISDPVPVSYSQSQSQSSSNLVPVQRRISGICRGGLTGIQNIQRRV